MVARPSSVTAAAIVGIVLASLGILCNLIALAGAAMQSAIRTSGSSGASSSTTPVPLPGWMMAVGAIAAVAFLVIAIVWLVVSIGLLKIAGWALSLATKLAPLHIVLLVLWLGVNLILIAPESKKALEEQFQQQQQSSQRTPPPPGFAKGFAVGAAYAGPVLSFVLAMILPVTMLICLSRPTAKAAFGQVSPPLMSE